MKSHLLFQVAHEMFASFDVNGLTANSRVLTSDTGTMQDADLIKVAKLVRAYLPDLVGEQRAIVLDRRIGEVVNRDAPDPVRAGELRTVLGEDDPVLEWVEEVLDDPWLLPPGLPGAEVRDVGYESLPGAGAPIQAERFSCPVNGDTDWYRPGVGVPVPVCGTHGCRLVRS